MRLILEAQQKYLQSFINNVTYHSMNLDAEVTYQTANLFSSDKCFIYFISDAQHYIRSNQYNTVCIIPVKVDVLDACTRYMWRKNMFLLWNLISAIFYEDRKRCLLFFINGLIFDVINIQNNQSPEFE